MKFKIEMIDKQCILKINNIKKLKKLVFLKKEKSIATVFMILFGILLSATILISQYSVYSHNQIKAERNLKRINRERILEFAKIIADPLYNLDINLIKNISNFFLTKEDIVGIYVYDHNDVYFKKLFPNNIQTYSLEEDIVYVREHAFDIGNDKIHVGKVKLYFSRKNLIDRQKENKIATLISVVSVLVAIVIGTLFIIKYFFTTPFISINKGLEAIANGDYEYEFKNLKYIEIKRMGRSAQRMAKQIQKREFELRNLKDNLELIVQQRTAELKSMNANLKIANISLSKAKKEAETAAQAKSEFLANMSHEIRTPMNGVIAAADLGLAEKLTPKLEKYLKIIHSSGYSLLGLINDILDFSKIEAGKLELEDSPFQICEILNRLGEMFVNKTNEKKIELLIDYDPDTPSAYFGDSLRIQQIITNLIGNAVKFTDHGGIITIGVRIKKDHSSKLDSRNAILEFYVKDTGMGMKPEFLKNLFQPFTQESASTTRKFGGTGLGLSISKKLVEMMGGQIWAKSQLNFGTTFYFTVNLKKQPSEVELRYKAPKEMAGFKVLVVDDCEDSRRIIAKMLTSFGFTVDSTTLGSEAIEKIKQGQQKMNNYDFITLDWMMPEMNGIDVSKIIRKTLKLDIPIIMMTAFGKDNEEKIADQAQINAFLTKPISQSTLFNTIMEIFGKNHIKLNDTNWKITTKRNLFSDKLKGAHILLAEDNQTNQEIATAILESIGIKVSIANNGKEVLEMMDINEFDAILMDIQMPELDGYAATKAIRKIDKYSTLPIIAMTAHAMKGDEEKCLTAGMDGYVSKPIRQDSLFHELSTRIKQIKNKPSDSKQEIKQEGIKEKDIAIPSSLPGISIQATLESLQISKNKYLKILNGFKRNHRDIITEIWDAYTSHEWKTVIAKSHFIKGSSANIGAYELSECAKELESAAKSLNGSEKALDIELIHQTEKELDKVLSSIEILRSDFGNENPIIMIGLNKKVALPLLIELCAALDSSDPVKTPKIINELKNHIPDEKLKEIVDLIEDYEYQECKEKVTCFIQDMDKMMG